jgi:hypothetical protein
MDIRFYNNDTEADAVQDEFFSVRIGKRRDTGELEVAAVLCDPTLDNVAKGITGFMIREIEHVKNAMGSKPKAAVAPVITTQIAGTIQAPANTT